jgi:hypothetical protein
MRWLALLGACAFLLRPSTLLAQSDDPWWKQFEIREAFDGDSGEQQAGSVGFVDPGKDTPAYFLLDGGIRLKPQSVHLGDSQSPAGHEALLIWYPSFEWHHLGSEALSRQEATNSGGPGLNAELWIGNPDSTSLKVYFLAKGAVTRDVLNDTTEKSASMLLGLFQAPADASVNGGFRPGSPIKVGGYQRVRYFPYFGFEYFRQLAITSGDDTVAPIYDGGDFLAKVDFEITPFHHETLPGHIRFVVSGKYEYRHLLKQIAAIDSREAQFVNAEISYYFVTDRKFGLGLTFDSGKAPGVNFTTQHRTALVLKAKL